jgi:hypothetical protein
VVEEEAVQRENVNETEGSKQQDVLDRVELAKETVFLPLCCGLTFYLKMETVGSS